MGSYEGYQCKVPLKQYEQSLDIIESPGIRGRGFKRNCGRRGSRPGCGLPVAVIIYKMEFMMLKKMMVTIFISCLVVSGCATAPKPTSSHVEKQLSLEEWVDYVAVPYLVKELGDNPRFKGEPFLLVSMDRDNVEAHIDALTSQLREEMIDGLLTKPGVGLVWRPSTKPWEHHTSLKQVPCNESMKEKYYVGIDAAISSVNGKLNVKIRALDITEKRWVTGFGISWQGRPSDMQKKALEDRSPDEYLLGLRPLPFNERQADLLAAYLSRNLSCLFNTMERDETIVYVQKENPGNLRYFENAFGLVTNYLARYREVMVTDDPAKANITILARVHPVHSRLFQVWVSAKYKKDETYVPGRETEAYVALPANAMASNAPKSPKSVVDARDSKSSQNKSSVAVPVSHAKNFDICFYDYMESLENDFFPLLKKYPGVTGIHRIYDRCGAAASCVCYELLVDSMRYGHMEELIQWLEARIGASGAYHYKLNPLSSERLRIVFSRGFE